MTSTIKTGQAELAPSRFAEALVFAAKPDRFGVGLLRLALVVVTLWIGGLKFVNYEAEGIVPLVANSPVMAFFYHRRAPEYKAYMNKEGETNVAHLDWHENNGTYAFSHGLGIVIIGIGLMISLHPLWPNVAAIGSFLLIGMACTTLSFLITTPRPGFLRWDRRIMGFPTCPE